MTSAIFWFLKNEMIFITDDFISRVKEIVLNCQNYITLSLKYNYFCTLPLFFPRTNCKRFVIKMLKTLRKRLVVLELICIWCMRNVSCNIVIAVESKSLLSKSRYSSRWPIVSNSVVYSQESCLCTETGFLSCVDSKFPDE